MRIRNFTHIGLIAAPLAYLFLAWSLNWYMGFISFSHPRDSLSARNAGAALMMPLMTAVAWWGCRACLLNGSTNLSKVIEHRRRKTANHVSSLLAVTLDAALRRAMPSVVLLAACIGTVYLFFERLLVNVQADMELLFLSAQIFPLWTAILALIYATFIVFSLMSRHIRHHLRVRLFEIERLQPVCNLVVVNFLISSALISLYSINILVVNLPRTDLLIIVGMLGVILFSLLYPMYLIRRAVAYRKHATLERLNHSLNSQLGNPEEKGEDRRLVDDEAKLQYISDLLTVRKEVMDAPLWPINLPFTVKLLGLISLPLVSWIGAGLVSQLLKLAAE